MISLKSHAKLNLALDVGHKTESGYHLIQTVFQEITLTDEIDLTMEKSDVRLECSFGLPREMNSIDRQKSVEFSDFDLEHNSILKTALLVKEMLGEKRGVTIRLKKKIPLKSGLGGASSNAAAVIKGLCKLWKSSLSFEQERVVALDAGMDATFFLQGGTAMGAHFGEEITPLPSLKGVYFVIVFPMIPISTAWAYQQIDNYKIRKNGLYSMALSETLQGQKGYLTDLSLLHNDFDVVLFSFYPQYKSLFRKLTECGAESVHACGSGGAIYGAFKDASVRDIAEKMLGREFEWVCAV